MSPQSQDPIEDALHTYPLAEVPPDFSKRIMRQIRTSADLPQTRAARADIRFRLTWMDYALGFFLALLPVVGFLAWSALPGLVWLRLAFQWQVLQTAALQPALLAVLSAAGILLFLAFLFSLDFMLRPRLLER